MASYVDKKRLIREKLPAINYRKKLSRQEILEIYCSEAKVFFKKINQSVWYTTEIKESVLEKLY
jgi:GLPGLI family protein